MAYLKSQTAKKKLLREDSGSDSGSESDSDSYSEPPEKAGTVTTVKSKSSEGNEPKISSIKTLKPPSAVSAVAKEYSGSDTDSGSESEPEQPEKAIPVTVTPAKSKKKEVNDSPAAKSVRKRGNEGASTELNAKRAKNKSGEFVESAFNSSLVKSKNVEKKKEKSNGKGKKVEEDNEEGILGGDFEKSFLFRSIASSIASLGVDECSVMRKWSKVPLESKKRIEEMFKLVEAKDYESLLMKADILKEVTTNVLSEAV